jgi:hypothetical protein
MYKTGCHKPDPAGSRIPLFAGESNVQKCRTHSSLSMAPETQSPILSERTVSLIHSRTKLAGAYYFALQMARD